MAIWIPKVDGEGNPMMASHINALQTGKVDSDGSASPTFAGLTRVGGLSDYSSMDESGRLSMVGQAKCAYRIRPAVALTAAGLVSNKPPEIIRGANLGWEFQIYSEEPELEDHHVFFKSYVPGRWDEVTDPQLGVLVSTGAEVESIGAKFKFKLCYATTPQGGVEIVKDTYTDIYSEITVISGGEPAYTAYDMWFTMPCGNVLNPMAPGRMLAGRLLRVEASSNEIIGTPIIWDWVLCWTTNKIGSPAVLETIHG